MFNIFLIIHIVIAMLLITVILLQKSNTDGLGSLSGGNSGFVTAKTAANFLTKLTICLAVVFLINSIILANLSIKKPVHIIEDLEKQQKNLIPVAK